MKRLGRSVSPRAYWMSGSRLPDLFSAHSTSKGSMLDVTVTQKLGVERIVSAQLL